MQLNLGPLKKQPLKTLRYVFRENPETLGWLETDDNAVNENSEVVIHLETYYNDSVVFVSGTMKMFYHVECSRCLEVLSKDTECAFKDELKIVQSDTGEEEARPLTGEMEESYSLNRETIDMEEYFRQLFVLSQDIKPLCSTECPGICPVCGINRNTDKCSCETEEFDIRLSGLKELKDIINEDNRRN